MARIYSGDYKDYLMSAHWQAVRKKRLEIDGYRCSVCGLADNLNVHHLSYKNLGAEDIENDLVTLCHSCHATLHRVKEQTRDERNNIRTCEPKYKKMRTSALWRKIQQLLMVEIWMRDKSNGGNISIFGTGMKMVGSLSKISERIYPELSFSDVREERYWFDLKDVLRLAKAAKICVLYREYKSISKVAAEMNMKDSNVQKVLKRHGFNAAGKIK